MADAAGNGNNGNGADHGADEGNGVVARTETHVGTLFETDERDMGEVAGIGRVIVHEAKLGDIWPFMREASSPEFPLRVLAASITIDGKPVTFEQLRNLGVRHLMAIRGLLPAVMEINALSKGLAVADEDEEAGPKNAAAGSGPDA